jgi:hypothetical protein
LEWSFTELLDVGDIIGEMEADSLNCENRLGKYRNYESPEASEDEPEPEDEDKDEKGEDDGDDEEDEQEEDEE